MLQLPPIPGSAALFIPPGAYNADPSTTGKQKSEAARSMLHMIWGEDADALNYFAELKEQMRIENDQWYSALLQQCRRGDLSEEMYNFLIGVPTQHCGSWLPAAADERSTSANIGRSSCREAACLALTQEWKSMVARGELWDAMAAKECEVCQKESER